MALELYIEYLKNPIGIDMQAPRFFWVDPAKAQGEQKAWRILVGKDPSLNEDRKNLVWDSGTVNGGNSIQVEYAGCPLESLTPYYWKVISTDSQGKETESETACFVTGLMDEKEWKGEWITPAGMSVWATRFRRKVYLKSRPVRAYSLFASINYYILYVNGKKATDTVLNNADTDPAFTIPYLMLDVTDLLQQGDNVLAVDLGCGWPGMLSTTDWGGIIEHGFAQQLVVEYEDGSRESFCSDKDSWIYTTRSPYVRDSIYDGEYYNATLDDPGWNTTACDPKAERESWARYTAPAPGPDDWRRPIECEPPTGRFSAQLLEPIRTICELEPVHVWPLADGSYTFDLGQNFAGWVRLTTSGQRGQTITLSYAELEHEDHSVNKMSIRKALAVDHYVLAGTGTEVYEPGFTFHGFRYVNIAGLTKAPEKGTVIGCVVSSDVKKIGSFVTSDPLVNQLQHNVCWTEISNLHSLPTDCPQRDERLGWTNDMTVRNECALYNFRLPALYSKWMRDIRDTQGIRTGALTDTAPYRRFGIRAQDPVAAVPAVLPWNVYLQYADKRILEQNYEMNKRWAAFLKRNSDDHIVRWSHMGDWAGPLEGTHAAGDEGIGGGAVSTITPTILVGTAHAMHCSRLLAKMAKVLGKPEDQVYYEKEVKAYKDALLSTYYDARTKNFAGGSQGSNTVGLYFGIVPEADRAETAAHLAEDILAHGTHVTTGNLCSRYILEVLFQNGYKDLAYDLITQTTYPSWGYMVENGATTMWERWEKITDWSSHLSEMASYNHPMNGAFAVSFYKYLAGINPCEEHPGYEEFTVKPYVPKKLQEICASLETMRGVIRVNWKQENSRLTLEVTVPYNTRAQIFVPVWGNGDIDCGALSDQLRGTAAGDGYVSYAVEAGTYTFVCS